MREIIPFLFKKIDLFPKGSIDNVITLEDGSVHIEYVVADAGVGSFGLSLTRDFINVFNSMDAGYVDHILSKISAIGEWGRKLKGFDTVVVAGTDDALIKSKYHTESEYKATFEKEIDTLILTLQKMVESNECAGGLESSALDGFLLSRSMSKRLDDFELVGCLTGENIKK